MMAALRNQYDSCHPSVVLTAWQPLSVYFTPLSSQHPHHGPRMQLPNHTVWRDEETEACNSPMVTQLERGKDGRGPKSNFPARALSPVPLPVLLLTPSPAVPERHLLLIRSAHTSVTHPTSLSVGLQAEIPYCPRPSSK